MPNLSWVDRRSHSRIAIVFWHWLNGLAVFYELSNRADDNFRFITSLPSTNPTTSLPSFCLPFYPTPSLLALPRYLVGVSSPSFPRRINLCRSLFFRDSAFEILLPWLKESVDSPGFLGKLTRASRKSMVLSFASFSFSVSPLPSLYQVLIVSFDT